MWGQIQKNLLSYIYKTTVLNESNLQVQVKVDRMAVTVNLILISGKEKNNADLKVVLKRSGSTTRFQMHVASKYITTQPRVYILKQETVDFYEQFKEALSVISNTIAGGNVHVWRPRGSYTSDYITLLYYAIDKNYQVELINSVNENAQLYVFLYNKGKGVECTIDYSTNTLSVKQDGISTEYQYSREKLLSIYDGIL